MKKKIFFVGSLDSSFIRNDYEELQKFFDMKKCEIDPTHNFKTFRFYHSVWEILKNVVWCDTVYSWFASWRAIFPTIFAKILGKKVVIIAGGYDVVNEPSINYGAWIKIPDRWVSKFLFKYADIVLPVSEYIQKELLEKVQPKETCLIYNGVKIEKFYPQGKKIDGLVITVGEVNWNNLKRKGIENFVKAAKYLPAANFFVIGRHRDDSIEYLKRIATPNVFFTGYVSSKELLWWYQRAKVYAQLSFHEGFGLSVAEAMLCECIPVTTSRGALPEVTGKQEYRAFYNYPAVSAWCIEKALKEKKTGMAYRHRIIEYFSLENRISALRKVLK
jgi:glycosyltransferase involved in cell wall biosynthesis